MEISPAYIHWWHPLILTFFELLQIFIICCLVSDIGIRHVSMMTPLCMFCYYYDHAYSINLKSWMYLTFLKPLMFSSCPWRAREQYPVIRGYTVSWYFSYFPIFSQHNDLHLVWASFQNGVPFPLDLLMVSGLFRYSNTGLLFLAQLPQC